MPEIEWNVPVPPLSEQRPERAQWPDASELQLRKFLIDMRVETAHIKDGSEEALTGLFDRVLAKLQQLPSQARLIDPFKLLSCSR